MDCIDLFYDDIVDVSNEGFEEEMEMDNPSIPSMKVVVGGDRVEVTDIRFHFLQYLCRCFYGNYGNGLSFTAKFHDVLKILTVSLKCFLVLYCYLL